MGATTTSQVNGIGGTLASWWRSRFGARLLAEIALCAGLLMVYREVRSFSETDLGVAFQNARDVLQLERWLGLPFENDLQSFLLDHPVLIKLLNHYYVWMHFPVAIGLLVWMYFFHPRQYRPTRWLMTVVTFAALAIHLIYPLAPPRMMPGFVDTMFKYGPVVYNPNALEGAANQIAAMPSLHFGWALIAAMAAIKTLRSPWRWLLLLHPTLMTLAIIATANHWWLDAVAAGVIVFSSLLIARLVVFVMQSDELSDELDDADYAFEPASYGAPSNESSVANDDADDRASVVG